MIHATALGLIYKSRAACKTGLTMNTTGKNFE